MPLITKWRTHIFLFFVWVGAMLCLTEFTHYWIRLLFVGLGFIAMWSLWVAREKRGDNWTEKTKNIWLCHMIFVTSTVMANIQLFYRKEEPTLGVLVVGYALLLTLKGTFNNDKTYTLKYTGLYTKHPGA